MTGRDFDLPGSDDDNPDWGALYAAVGNEVVAERPVFTGDVFEGVPVTKNGQTRQRAVMVLHHPCTIRSDGVHLNDSILVATVDRHRRFTPEEWQGNYDKMPLPAVAPHHETPGKRDRAAFFDRFYTVSPADLNSGTRIAVLSQLGVNILLQRYVHHTSRVIVPTFRFQDVTGGRFEEADLIQEWCESMGGDLDSESAAAVAWLREKPNESAPTRQAQIDDPQYRAAVRRDMRQQLKKLHSNRP